MAGKRSRMHRPIWLSTRATFAAERLAEIAGLPATELLEMVLLELAESSEIVEASIPQKPQRSTAVGRHGPARIIPIETSRLRARRSQAAHANDLRQRSRSTRERASAACRAGAEARRRSAALLRTHGVDW
jgi:hypothetical protein